MPVLLYFSRTIVIKNVNFWERWLKNTVNENWNLFNNDNGKKITEDDVLFIDERTDEYIKLVEHELAQNQNNANNNKNTINIVFNEEEEINVDDI